MAVDLSDYYPQSGVAASSPRSDGSPANPGAAGARNLTASGSLSIGGSPALALIGIVALSLFLLHME